MRKDLRNDKRELAVFLTRNIFKFQKTKKQLAKYLGCREDVTEEEFLKLLVKKLKNRVEIKDFCTKFSRYVAFYPKELEEYLQITKRERLRWDKEDKLTVCHVTRLKSVGDCVLFGLYDAYQAIFEIKEDDIKRWREAHLKEVEQNKKQGIKKAANSRKRNAEMRKIRARKIEEEKIRREEYEKKLKREAEEEYNQMINEWSRFKDETSVIFTLCYWTMWMSRWAKGHELNGNNQKKELCYQKKAEALRIITKSELIHISTYQPTLKTRFELCWKHDRRYAESYDYESRLEYFYSNYSDIKRCPHCKVDEPTKEKIAYYSLYCIDVNTPETDDYHFSFHIPRLIGEDFLPPFDEQPQTTQKAQEGIFKFGRPIRGNEEITHTEKICGEQFEKAYTRAAEYMKMPINPICLASKPQSDSSVEAV